MIDEEAESSEPQDSVESSPTTAFEAFGKMMQAMMQVSSGLSKTLGKFASQSEGLREDIAATFTAIREGISAFIELNPTKILSTEYGWPPMFNMDLDYYADLVLKAQEINNKDERQKYVDEKVTAYFRGNELDSLLVRWRKMPFLETDRLAIIEDAFQAHKEGKYSLSSPAILAQTEGLAFEWLVESEKENSVSKMDYEKLSNRTKDEHGEGSVAAFTSEALYEFVIGYGLYSMGDDKNPLAYAISRHKILHGSYTEYYKHEDISLRHLLWLDGIINLIDYQTPTDEEDSSDS